MAQRVEAARLRRGAGIRALAAVGLLAATTPFAQAQTDPAEPPVSNACQTPGLNVTGEVPLPNVQAALKDRKVVRILEMGASSKAGGDPSDKGYFSIVKTLLEKTMPGIDVEIIDRGISGELARDAAQRMTTLVALLKPDLVLWQLGTHDALQQVPVDEFRSSVEDTIVWLRQHHVDVVIVGLHYIRRMADDPHYQLIRATLSKVAEEQKVLRIGRYEAMQVIERAHSLADTTPPSEFALTESGYGCLAEYVARAVTSAVFMRNPKTARPRG